MGLPLGTRDRTRLIKRKREPLPAYIAVFLRNHYGPCHIQRGISLPGLDRVAPIIACNSARCQGRGKKRGETKTTKAVRMIPVTAIPKCNTSQR